MKLRRLVRGVRKNDSLFSFSALKRPCVLYHLIALATVSIKTVKVPSVRRVRRTDLRSPVDQGEHYMTSEYNSVYRATLTERRILIR
ncbi:hypothetical protein RB195_004532 [Necator americanus]|uniref:Uncharacterized protein n=1 Tax=Necator americanus TaxID=51031 RepID=A0ABR1BIG5_NECAM